MSLIRVGILSDTHLFSEGVARVVGGGIRLQLVEIGDEGSLMAMVSSGRLQILLLDGRKDNVLALCRQVRSAEMHIIVLAVPDDGPLAADALIAGASGILYESARADEVVRAITLVRQGTIWAPRHVVAAAWRKCIAVAEGGERMVAWQRLSVREREVMRHAAAGFANKELADRLAISEATVKVHLTHIFQKVGCRSRTELAAAYFGIDPLDVERRAPAPIVRAILPRR